MNAPNEPEEIKPDHPQPDKPSNDAPPKQSLAGARLRRHADYQRAYAASRKRQSASMSWFVAPRQMNSPTDSEVRIHGARVGLTAGKVLGKAHERNRIKRRMREVLRRLKSDPDRSVADIPVVMVTARVGELDRIRGGRLQFPDSIRHRPV